MSRPHPPKKSLLVMGVLAKDKSLFKNIHQDMKRLWGECIYLSKWLNFSHTDYYKNEMGDGLKRRLILFKNLSDIENLVQVKYDSWELEKKYLKNGNREINIDPGFLSLDKFILLTGKNYSHRIYLGKGVYADLTLLYKNNSFVSFDWTYLDYQSEEIINFLLKSRSYLGFINSKKPYEREML